MTEVDYEALPETTSLAAQLFAGAMAGITEHTVMHPFDSIKTRLQIVNPSPQAAYTGMINAVSKISSTEGLRSLWRGVSSVVLGAGPAHAIYFATYEQTKQMFNSNGHSHLGIGLAGACSTIASDAFMNPFDVVKQRMQVHGSTYTNIFQCASSILKKEGFKAFYISYPTTLTITIPFTSIQFMTYEATLDIFNPKRDYNPFYHSLSGAIAGGTAAAITTPLDVVKTLLQTRGTSIDPEIRQCNGLVNAAKIIYKKEGMKGFSKGMGPRILSHMPSTALCWTAYEYFKWFLKETNPATSS